MKYIISVSNKSDDISEMLKQYTIKHGGHVDVFRYLVEQEYGEVEEPFNRSDYDMDELYEEHAEVYIQDGMTQESYLDELRINDMGKLEIHYHSWGGCYDGWLSPYYYEDNDLLHLANRLDIDYDVQQPMESVPCISVDIDDFATKYDISHLSDDEKRSLLEEFKSAFQRNDSVMECFWLLIDYMAEDKGFKKLYAGERYAEITYHYKDTLDDPYSSSYDDVIVIGEPVIEGSDEDNNSFFHVSSHDELLALMQDNNGEDFIVESINGYSNEI